MKTIKLSDLSYICLICMENDSVQKYSIFDEDNDGKMFSEKVLQFWPAFELSNSNYPKKICTNCLYELSSASQFVAKCENSYKLLETMLKTLENSLNKNQLNKNQKEVDEKVVHIPKADPLSEVEESYYKFENYKDVGSDSDWYPDDEKEENTKKTKTKTKTKKLKTIKRKYPKDQNSKKKKSSTNKTVTKLIFRCHKEILEQSQFEEGYVNQRLGKSKSISKDTIINNDNRHLYEDISSYLEIEPYRDEQLDERLVNDNVINEKKSGIKKNHVFQCNKFLDEFENNIETDKFVCELCGNTYKKGYLLKYHLQMHSDERPFDCELCPKKFKFNHLLSQHMLTHTGIKNYPCKVCDRRFGSSGQRTRHMRIHTGEKPYKCSICQKGFANSGAVKVHQIVHTGLKRFKCLYRNCGRGFTKKEYLDNHVNSQHSYIKIF